MSAITIHLQWPPREVSPNFKAKHWSIPAEAKRTYRKACWADARNAKDCHTVFPLCGPLEAHVVFVQPSKNRSDLDNLIASLKAGLDGIADAKVIANDKDIVVWTAELEQGPRKEVVLTLREKAL